jgi:hypothetical protein
MLANFSGEKLTIPKATVLGVAEEVSETLIDSINTGIGKDGNLPSKPPRKKRNEALNDKLLSGKLDHLTPDELRHIEPVRPLLARRRQYMKVHEVIKLNLNPIYASHPGIKRMYSLIALRYWWPGMLKTIEDYVKACDLCQRRKQCREFVAPLEKPDEPTPSSSGQHRTGADSHRRNFSSSRGRTSRTERVSDH